MIYLSITDARYLFRQKKKINNKVFDTLIDYFCNLEEYEKCAELKKIKESKKNITVI